MMKFMIIGSDTYMHLNFRSDLIKKIADKGYEVVSICPQSAYKEEFKKINSRLITIENKKDRISPFRDIIYFFNLYKIIKREKPDKVLAYTIKPVIYGVAAAKFAKVDEIYCLITGLGFVYTLRNFKTKLLRLFTRIGYKYAFKCSNKVILQNKDDLEDLVKNKYVSKDKCVVVSGSGVNMQRYKYQKLPKKIQFIMISRMIKSKGVKQYLEAARIIKAEYPNVNFLYIGDTQTKQDAFKKEKLNYYIDAKIIQYIPKTNQIQKYIAKSSVVVLPSYYREGIPRTLLEGMAMGRVIITTDCIGCRETVIDNENGFLIEPHNVKQLVDKMKWCIQNQDNLQDMGKKSYEYCKKRFDVKIVNEDMLKIMKIKGSRKHE